MRANMTDRLERLSRGVLRFVGSDSFFKIVVILAILQGLWYALSFQPFLFDEAKHLGFISMYTEQASPFITEQDPKWDKLGDTTRDGSYLFYYLMSILLRLVETVTSSTQFQIIILRFVDIAIFIVGLYILRNTFLKMKIGRSTTNLSLLGFLLIPAFAPLPGVISYDILSFTLFALVLKIAVDVISTHRFDIRRLILLVSLGGFMSVIKFSNIALILPVLLIAAIIYIRRYGRRLGGGVSRAFGKLGTASKILFILLFIASVAIVIERPVQNIVKYRSPAPECTEIHSAKSCYKDYVSKRNQDFIAAKPQNFTPIDGFSFFYINFIPGMLKTLSQQWPLRGPLPSLFAAANILFIGSFLLIVMNIKSILRNRYQMLLLITVVFYIVILFAQIYSSYVKLGQPVAISGRYLMPVAPLFIVLALVSLRAYLTGMPLRRTTLGAIIILLIFSISQGGGIITHSISVNNPDYYWSNNEIREINMFLRSGLQKIVDE